MIRQGPLEQPWSPLDRAQARERSLQVLSEVCGGRDLPSLAFAGVDGEPKSPAEPAWPYTLLHAHAHNEIAVCVVGQPVLETTEQQIRLPPGSVCFVPAGSLHREAYSAPASAYTLLWMLAEADIAWLWVSAYVAGGRPSFSTCHFARVSGVDSSLLRRAQLEAMSRQCGYRVAAASHVCCFLWTVIRGRWSNELLLPRLVEEAYALVRQSHAEPLTPGGVAAALGVDAEYLSATFKHVTGRTLRELITEERLRSALYLLANGEASIEEVARRCGYPDPYYFSRVCSKVLGMSPSRVRPGAAGRND